MRILHTSDWHLGRIFHGIHMIEEQKFILDQLLSTAEEKKVDVILIAGDIYDRAVPPTDAVTLLDKTLSKIINELHLPVILIAGNHDNPERLDFGKELFASNNLYIYGAATAKPAPVVLKDEFGEVYFAPLTYCEPLVASALSKKEIKTHEDAIKWQVETLLKQIPQKARKIALAHVFLTNAQETPESERPLSIGGASTVAIENFKDFNYTALGHLHAWQKNSDKVYYPGSLLKYSFSEVNQKKACNIIDLDKDGNIVVETVELKPQHELAVLQGSFDELLNKPAPNKEDYLRIILTDEAPILDAKHRLDAVYPHILLLEYARLIPKGDNVITLEDRKKVDVRDLFNGFFKQINNRDLNAKEIEVFDETLRDLSDSERRS